MTAFVEWYRGDRLQEWRTPRTLFDPLHEEFRFDLDGAADEHNSLLPMGSTPTRPVSWVGRNVFCNPPWSDIKPFIEMAALAASAVLLVPARTNARWFHRALALGATPRFFVGKPRFERPDGTTAANSPVDCILLVWEHKETAAVSPLRTSEGSMDTAWYCSYCGDQHVPDAGTLVDARYALGRCGGTKRQLVRSEAEAIRLAEAGGKLRPKGVPLGGGQARRKPTTADPVQTKVIQGGSR